MAGPAHHTQSTSIMTDDLSSAWAAATEAWLDAKRQRTQSKHTDRAYTRDHCEFFAFVDKEPWLVDNEDALAWTASLEARGLANATVRRKLAVLSSFYAYVIERDAAGSVENGEQRLFIDRRGKPLPNPFAPVQRPERQAYADSRPLSTRVVKRALQLIDPSSRRGARDYALITAYLYTGRRNQEIAVLRWGDVEVDEERRRYYYTWRGHGDTVHHDELPPPVYHAIVHFLQVMDWWPANDGLYIFRPIYPDRGRHLPNVKAQPANRPMTEANIRQIIKKRFVDAGVARSEITVHTLRHTAAALRYRDGKGQDVLEISRFLGHSTVGTTQLYLSKRHKPIDPGWPDVEQILST